MSDDENKCKSFGIDNCPIPICTKKAKPPLGFGLPSFYCGNNNLNGINNYCKKYNIDECPSPYCITVTNTSENSINESYCGANEKGIDEYLKHYIQ